MSAPSDNTRFAARFDFETEDVSLMDLVGHLRVMFGEPEVIGMANAMACAAAADLIQAAYGNDERPGGLINRLRRIDHNTWGEV